jgi:DNA processing protein
MENNLLFAVGLTKIHHVGPVLGRQLIYYCGSPEEVFNSSARQLLKIPGLGNSIVSEICSKKVLTIAEIELKDCLERNIDVLYFKSLNYPSRLANLPDSPIVIYQIGTLDWEDRFIISVVGTRKPSHHGLEALNKILDGIKEFNPIIVSGLAFGVDAEAHQFCLKNNLRTAGVIAHGLGSIYPADHRELAEHISRQGALLSEYPWSVRAEKEFFPMRNRIIAGLSDGVLVVETAERGGSMITAQLANDYDREVMALPGRINDKWSQGCLKLIKNQEASLVSSSEDIIRILQWKDNQTKQMIIPFLEPQEKKIVDLYGDAKSVSLEYLLLNSSLSVGMLSQWLLDMEFKGLIKELPGKRYQKLI